MRTLDEWTPESACGRIAALPLIEVDRLGDRPGARRSIVGSGARLLAARGLRTTLAAHGADVRAGAARFSSVEIAIATGFGQA
ncbi:MAG: hypothetical protein R2697_15770 [Ilumatobacteraceae bacterium]